MILEYTEGDINGLNNLCNTVYHFDSIDNRKFGGENIYAQPIRVQELNNLAKALDSFEFIPEVKTPEDYGRYMRTESGHFEYDENLEGYYDFQKYGEMKLRQEQGKFIDRGYISYHGIEPIVDVMQREQTLEQEGGGMTMQ